MTGDDRMKAWQQSLIIRTKPGQPCNVEAIDTTGAPLYCTDRWGHAGYHTGKYGERWTTSDVWMRTPIKREKPANYLTRTDPATGLRHGWIRYPNGNPPAPFGCRWCGTVADNHHGGSIPGRPHTYTRPTYKQQKLRMLARRKNRKATT